MDGLEIYPEMKAAVYRIKRKTYDGRFEDIGILQTCKHCSFPDKSTKLVGRNSNGEEVYFLACMNAECEHFMRKLNTIEWLGIDSSGNLIKEENSHV